MKIPLVKKLSLDSFLRAIFIGGTIGVALKLILLMNNYVFLPYFPNILDSIFLIVSILYLGVSSSFEKTEARALKKSIKRS